MANIEFKYEELESGNLVFVLKDKKRKAQGMKHFIILKFFEKEEDFVKKLKVFTEYVDYHYSGECLQCEKDAKQNESI